MEEKFQEIYARNTASLTGSIINGVVGVTMFILAVSTPIGWTASACVCLGVGVVSLSNSLYQGRATRRLEYKSTALSGSEYLDIATTVVGVVPIIKELKFLKPVVTGINISVATYNNWNTPEAIRDGI